MDLCDWLPRQKSRARIPKNASLGALSKKNQSRHHPAFIVYMKTVRFLYPICMSLLQQKQFKSARKKFAKAERRYKVGTSQSPVFASYFNLWMFFDAQTKEKTTLGALAWSFVEKTGLDPNHNNSASQFLESYVGVYLHKGFSKNKIILKELITSQTFLVVNPSGCRGSPGEMWLTRLLPTKSTDFVALSTPYISKDSPQKWFDYFGDQKILPDPSHFKIYKDHMKRGKKPNYWIRYIWENAQNIQDDHAIIKTCPR